MAKNKSEGGWGYASRESVDAAAEAQEAKRNKTFGPLRHRLPNDKKSIQAGLNEVEIIILDECFVSPERGRGAFMIREHTVKTADGKWDNEACCADFDDCACCESTGKEGSQVAMMTCIVLKEWTDKKGNVHTYSRMLLPIKMGMKDTFLDLQQQAEKMGRTMRGMILKMRRGPDSKSVATGEPVMRDGGKLFGFVSEKNLLANFGHDAITGRDGKVLKEADADTQPFDYPELFPRPDPEDLRKRYGRSARPGSRSANSKFEDDADDDDVPAKGAPRTRKALDDDDADDAEEDDIPGNKAKAATGKGKASLEEDEDDAPPARSRAPKGKAALEDDDDAPPARSRRAPKASDEDATDDGW